MTAAGVEVALLPCPNPWCASHRDDDAELRAAHRPIAVSSLPGRREWRIECPVCPINGPRAESEIMAIAAWSTRAAAPARDAVAPGVREAFVWITPHDASALAMPASRWRDGVRIYRSAEAAGEDAVPLYGPSALAAAPSPEAPPPVAGEVGVVEWAREEGRDDGATFCIETLARQLKVDNYEQADGSETWEGDVSGTLLNVLRVARIYDDEDGAIARLPEAAPPPPPASDPAVELIGKIGHSPVEQADIAAAQLAIEGFRKTSGCYYADAKGVEHWLCKAFAAHRLAALSQRAGLDAGTLPDIGPNPMQTDGLRDGWEERLKQAYVIQQKGVPDQTALVWRFDLGQARYALIRNRAMAERWQEDRTLAAQPSGSDKGDS